MLLALKVQKAIRGREYKMNVLERLRVGHMRVVFHHLLVRFIEPLLKSLYEWRHEIGEKTIGRGTDAHAITPI